ALPDALDLGRVQGIDLRPALLVVLGQNAPCQRQRFGERLLQSFMVRDLAADVADDAPEIGLELLQASVRPFELLGMGVALLLDQRELADAGIGLTQAQTVLLR